MFLLDGHSLTKTRKVKAVSMNLQLKERDSTASITLTGDGSELDGIAIGKWMLDENEPGAGIVWQVRSVQQQYPFHLFVLLSTFAPPLQLSNSLIL